MWQRVFSELLYCNRNESQTHLNSRIGKMTYNTQKEANSLSSAEIDFMLFDVHHDLLWRIVFVLFNSIRFTYAHWDNIHITRLAVSFSISRLHRNTYDVKKGSKSARAHTYTTIKAIDHRHIKQFSYMHRSRASAYLIREYI